MLLSKCNAGFLIHHSEWKCNFNLLGLYGGTFIQQGHIKLNKKYSKEIYNVTKYLFQMNAVILNFPFIKES